jgi:hypothetical protein
MSKISEVMFDVRNIERFLAEGEVTPEQVQAHLDGLEDCSDNMETSAIQMIGHERSRRAVSSEEGGQEEDES